MNTVKLTARKFAKLRRKHRLPYVRIDRFTRLYDLEKVVAALQKLEINGKGTAAK